jgi:hypothetical protein
MDIGKMLGGFVVCVGIFPWIIGVNVSDDEVYASTEPTNTAQIQIREVVDSVFQISVPMIRAESWYNETYTTPTPTPTSCDPYLIGSSRTGMNFPVNAAGCLALWTYGEGDSTVPQTGSKCWWSPLGEYPNGFERHAFKTHWLDNPNQVMSQGQKCVLVSEAPIPTQLPTQTPVPAPCVLVGTMHSGLPLPSASVMVGCLALWTYEEGDPAVPQTGNKCVFDPLATKLPAGFRTHAFGTFWLDTPASLNSQAAPCVLEP